MPLVSLLLSFLLLQEIHRRFENAPDTAKTKALQTVIEMKDSKISSMERGLRDLEEEIQMLKSNGALSTEEREEEMKQMEVYRSHSKFMKNKQWSQNESRFYNSGGANINLCFLEYRTNTAERHIDPQVEQLKEELSAKEAQGEDLKKRVAGLQTEVSAIGQVKQELSRKDTELLALQTKLETLTNQFSDSKQHIEVLKESLTAKEQRAAILQTEAIGIVEPPQNEAIPYLNLTGLQLSEDIENLQEQLRDKEKQMSSLKDRVKSLQADTTNTDTALTTLEEALAEKEKTIERLKEQRDRDEREKQEEIDNYKKDIKDLKEKVSILQGDLTEKEVDPQHKPVVIELFVIYTSLLDLKEHASSLASSGLKKDSRLKTLEIALEQKKEECLKMETQLKKAHEATLEARASPELSDRMQQLEREVTRYREESGKAQAEVDRLLEILKEMENEKNDKDKKIAELERGKPKLCDIAETAVLKYKVKELQLVQPLTWVFGYTSSLEIQEFHGEVERQVKDQNKKVANLKHKEQVEKKKSAQMLEEARRREDNLNDSSQQLQMICLQLRLGREKHVLVGVELGWLKGCGSKQVVFTWSPVIFQDNLRKKDDRIEELEEALRESVQITAEREMVLAQEESARINAEKQVCNLEKSLVVLLGK
ncbi:ELKS/Rab6-interacting/CAST family member 1 [Willisornis vidua]|uniref:ELKS/Rab6-interacting/CAST family member 1 n=1 Tax=Willisornis vidua TaxID=1566151 RepID=A0ABQ9DAI7_9PASS|nr:ELKS/Rab6-interacting/CAST family member 1 [Willisornis vidua]